MNGPYHFPPSIHFICRECGTPCDPEAAKDRGGLCARCAFPTRVTVKTFQLAIDRERAVSNALEEAAQAIDGTISDVEFTPYAKYTPNFVEPVEPDPFKLAIDRAAAAWTNDNPEDPKQ